MENKNLELQAKAFDIFRKVTGYELSIDNMKRCYMDFTNECGFIDRWGEPDSQTVTESEKLTQEQYDLLKKAEDGIIQEKAEAFKFICIEIGFSFSDNGITKSFSSYDYNQDIEYDYDFIWDATDEELDILEEARDEVE